MANDSVFVNSNFLNDITNPKNVLTVFKMFYSYYGLVEGETVKAIQDMTDEERQVFFNYEGGLEKESGDTGIRNNPWYYPQTFIEDDIIKVKINDDNIRNWYSIFFVYDKNNGESETRNNLAFVIETRPDGYQSTVENYAENYFEFCLKGISDISCKFLTYTKNRLKQDDIKIEENGFKEKVLHNHRTGDFVEQEWTIFTGNEWLLGDNYIYTKESLDDILYKIADSTGSKGCTVVCNSETVNFESIMISALNTIEGTTIPYYGQAENVNTGEDWYIAQIDGKPHLLKYNATEIPNDSVYTIKTECYSSDHDLLDNYDLFQKAQKKIMETSETDASEGYHFENGKITGDNGDVLNLPGTNFEKTVGISYEFNKPDFVNDAFISYIDSNDEV